MAVVFQDTVYNRFNVQMLQVDKLAFRKVGTWLLPLTELASEQDLSHYL